MAQYTAIELGRGWEVQVLLNTLKRAKALLLPEHVAWKVCNHSSSSSEERPLVGRACKTLNFRRNLTKWSCKTIVPFWGAWQLWMNWYSIIHNRFACFLCSLFYQKSDLSIIMSWNRTDTFVLEVLSYNMWKYVFALNSLKSAIQNINELQAIRLSCRLMRFQISFAYERFSSNCNQVFCSQNSRVELNRSSLETTRRDQSLLTNVRQT